MSNKQWVRITPVQNIPLREGRSVNISGRDIAIFNLGDRLFAVDGRCPHKGGPLAEGIVTGNTVVCPLHAWKIDLETGSVTTPEAEGDRPCRGSGAIRQGSGQSALLWRPKPCFRALSCLKHGSVTIAQQKNWRPGHF
ncbi:MAG: hypothetical protein AUH16_10905 [Acidobacteria bacterium 13_2_20CM_57_7]|nr:MAG: hypothetical protein AUH16_10905 [Acidobacteria bacterium 13_2_20CM_57_7]